MSLRVLGTLLLTATIASCVPRELDPNVSDLDGDGIFDARDVCMSDPEDFDGYQDEDGCPESEGPEDEGVEREGRERAGEPGKKVRPSIKVRTKKVRRTKPKILKQRSAKAKTSKYQSSAWGALVDTEERAALVFGFSRAWVKADGTSTLVRENAYRGSFSPDGKHLALVTDKHFLVLDAHSAKRVARFRYAAGTHDSMETKLIYLGARGSVLFFDGCNLRRGTVHSKKTEVIAKSQCGSRPLRSKDGSRWFTWSQDDDEVAVSEIDVASGKQRVVLGGRGNAPGLSILLSSPDGKHLCYSRHRDGTKLTCRNLSSLEDLLVWKGATDKRPVFAPNGTLGFGTGVLREERDFYIADLESRKITKTGTLGEREEWLTPIGSGGFIASGGARLRHFDIENSTQVDITLGEGEWEGFAEIPGRSSEFFVGKERRSSRDLYRVTVP